jgi:hypothetical protein
MMPSGTMPAHDRIRTWTSRYSLAGGTTFYVNGVPGSDKNDCRSPQRTCKTIQHAVHISASGDTIDVAAAVYPENVSIHHSVHINGAGRDKTIVDVFNYGTLHVANSTFSGNTAAGGVGGAIHNGELVGVVGGVQIDNSTISGHAAALGESRGGCIYNRPGQPIYVQNTIIERQ